MHALTTGPSPHACGGRACETPTCPKLKLLGHRLVHRHSRPDGVARVAAAHRCRSASPARRQFCLVRYGAVFNVGVQLCVGLDGDGDEAEHANSATTALSTKVVLFENQSCTPRRRALAALAGAGEQ